MALTKTIESHTHIEVVFRDGNGEEVYRATEDSWLEDESESPITAYDREEYNLERFET